MSEIDCRKCPHAKYVSAEFFQHQWFRCEKRNDIMLTFHPPECEFLTLQDVCFSCQHFKWTPESGNLSHGSCPQLWPGKWFDGLKSQKCKEYITKHGNYPNKVRVVRIRTLEKNP